MTKDSREVLRRSLERRIRHVFTTALKEIERNCPGTTQTSGWGVARNNILTVGNDASRATVAELNDYVIHQKGISIDKSNDDIKIHLEKSGLTLFQNIEFLEDPIGFRVYASTDNKKTLEQLRNHIDSGIIYFSDPHFVYYIRGLDDCVNKLIPVLDKLKWVQGLSRNYNDWRAKVVNAYNGS